MLLGTWLVTAFCLSALAMTWDGTILRDGDRPDRPFNETLAVAAKALRANADENFCVVAQAKRTKYGGGWEFAFGNSNREGNRWIHVQRDGSVKIAKKWWPEGVANRRGPSVPIADAVSIASALMQKQDSHFFFVFARWNDRDDDWDVEFCNSQADSAWYQVDAKRSAKFGGIVLAFPSIHVYTEGIGKNPFQKIITAVWRDGRIIWSRNQKAGGPPYLTARIDPARLRQFFKQFAGKSFYEDDQFSLDWFSPSEEPTIISYNISIHSDTSRIRLVTWREVYEAPPMVDPKRKKEFLRDGQKFRQFLKKWSEIRTAIAALIPADGDAYFGPTEISEIP